MRWTDARVAFMVERWRDGESASLIARQLGGVTRNAVIGKLHRLGIMRAPVERQAKPQKRPAVKDRAAKLPKRLKVLRRVRAVACEPQGHGVTLYDIGAHACRWPVGRDAHGEHIFCGHDAEPGGSWCAFHAGRAFTKAAA